MAFKKIGGCWKTKSGKGYSCKLSVALPKDARFFIFKNENKEEDKQPDLNIMQADEEKPNEETPF